MLLNTCPSTLTGSWLPQYLDWVLIAPSQTWLVSWLGLDVAASTFPGQTHFKQQLQTIFIDTSFAYISTPVESTTLFNVRVHFWAYFPQYPITPGICTAEFCSALDHSQPNI
jgi:hypothetical protein